LKACVVFDSRFGNTEKVARSLGAGMEESGMETRLFRCSDFAVDSLKDYDIVCVGAPTEAFSASKPIKEFLGRLKGAGLSGKGGFSFDTRLDWRISGSAAKAIEKELRSAGASIVAPRESAIVSTTRSGGQISGAVLRDGEEERFFDLGKRLAAELLARGKPIVG
jgi:flavodoxin